MDEKMSVERGKVERLVRRKALKGRLFKNVHTGDLVIVTLQRWDHIYYAGDGTKGRQYKTVFPRNFIRVA